MGLGTWFRGILQKEEEEYSPEPTSSCEHCGIEYPSALMLGNGTYLICSDCNKKQKKDEADAEFKRKQALINSKAKFYCYNCKFHFSRRRELNIRICPNCGSENFVEEGKILK